MQVRNVLAIVFALAMAFSYMLYEVFVTEKCPSRSGSQKGHITGAIRSASLENSRNHVQLLRDLTKQSHSAMKRFTGAPLSATKTILVLLI